MSGGSNQQYPPMGGGMGGGQGGGQYASQFWHRPELNEQKPYRPAVGGGPYMGGPPPVHGAKWGDGSPVDAPGGGWGGPNMAAPSVPGGWSNPMFDNKPGIGGLRPQQPGMGGGPRPYRPPPPPGYGGGGWMTSCFVDGVQVELVDGSEKNVSEISVGDEVKTDKGDGIVTKIYPSKAGGQKLYGFNDKEPFVTEAHPFMTQDGWKKISEVTEGDTLYRNGKGTVTVESVISKEIPEDTPVYNFQVDGHETYFADGYLVHNKTMANPNPPDRWAGLGQGFSEDQFMKARGFADRGKMGRARQAIQQGGGQWSPQLHGLLSSPSGQWGNMGWDTMA